MYPIEGHFECRKCEHKEEIKDYEKRTLEEAAEERETLIIDEEMDTLPKTRIACPKCEHNEAYYRIRQMRAADEPETRIYRCVKCGHTWREN
jgi:DNA-directed RNA polymerase subunit M